jgi:hypothetical protein
MKVFSVIIFIFSILTISAQIYNETASDSGRQEVNKLKLYSILGVTSAGFIYGHAFLNELWWKGEKTSFHFNFAEDWRSSLGADKLGHFYFPYLVGNVYSELFQWSGVEEKRSHYYAASLAFFYQTYIEIRDGFSEQYGFSWGDFGANVLGASYPVLQYHYPVLKNFHFKISFYPSERFRNNSHGAIIDDYESTYHWLSFNIKNLLPENVGRHYPAFINLALGHSVHNLDAEGRHELYIALDWNLESLPGDTWLLKFLKKTFNHYHLPSPAVRVYPGVTWFGLKF